MASVLKITATIDVQSDVLPKDSGALVGEAIKQLIPTVVAVLKKEIAPAEENSARVEPK